MQKRFLQRMFTSLLGLLISACASAPAAAPTVSADEISTAAFAQVYAMQTQTALAVPPTPSATLTPERPTATPTETPIPEPTAPLKRPVVTAFAGCWSGPGPQYTLISNIEEKKYVTLLGIGDVPGWYIIRNPYFRNPCWIEAIYLKLDSRVDTSTYPVMTPTNP